MRRYLILIGLTFFTNHVFAQSSSLKRQDLNGAVIGSSDINSKKQSQVSQAQLLKLQKQLGAIAGSSVGSQKANKLLQSIRSLSDDASPEQMKQLMEVLKSSKEQSQQRKRALEELMND